MVNNGTGHWYKVTDRATQVPGIARKCRTMVQVTDGRQAHVMTPEQAAARYALVTVKGVPVRAEQAYADALWTRIARLWSGAAAVPTASARMARVRQFAAARR